MMNTPLSRNKQLVRYLVAGPLVLAVALGVSAARAQGTAPQTLVADKAPVAVSAQTQPALQSQVAAAIPAAKPVVEESKPTKPRPKSRDFQPAPASSKAKTATPATSEAPAQASVPKPRYYVDGKLYTSEINTLDAKTIANIYVLKGDQARQAFGDEGANGVVIITTKANQNQPDVLAFNQKVGAAPAAAPAAAEKPERVAYLAAPALAYIVKNYPAARLISVSEVAAADSGTPRYEAMIVIGRRPGYLLFDGQGQFISESYTKSAR